MRQAARLIFLALAVLVVAAAASAAGSPASPVRIAFVVKADDYTDAATDIHVFQGTRTRNVGRRAVLEYDPQWSPRGDRIAFIATRSNYPIVHIFVMKPDGSARRQLTRSAGEGDYSYLEAWSPDGRRILYTRTVRPPGGAEWPREIYVMNADGRAKRRLTNNRLYEQSPTWSPDGRSIVFLRTTRPGTDVFAMQADGRQVRRLTSTHDCGSPWWSPDGQFVVFERYDDNGHPSVNVMRADGTAMRRLARGSLNEKPWSPDGEQIVFQSADPRRPGINAVRVDGSELRQLTRRGDDNAPAWSPDGRRIVFVRRSALWLVNADGGGLRRLTRPRGTATHGAPAWARVPVAPH